MTRDEVAGGLFALLSGRGGLSAEQLPAVLAAGGIALDGRRVAGWDQPLRPGASLVVTLSERGRKPAGAPTLDSGRLLYLDEAMVVVDKPPFLMAQGTAADAQAGLDSAVSRLLRARGERSVFVGLVHRLDAETSGVTVLGRTPAAVSALAAQFRLGSVSKSYRCLVGGVPGWTGHTVDAPLGADPQRPGWQCISPRGRPALTRLQCEARFDDGAGLQAAMVVAQPATGRTHQIRVHLASAGHPLLGDRRYGGAQLLTSARGDRLLVPRVALHAASLALTHPDGHPLRFEAPWPTDLAAVEQTLSALCRSAPAD